ncbi:hypothetical protein GL2_30950 [Microbulbifer sp. GL-2]|nr:hypothetical protein GL2_30950 [Microbulbifer sp. GL-2]
MGIMKLKTSRRKEPIHRELNSANDMFYPLPPLNVDLCAEHIIDLYPLNTEQPDRQFLYN